MCTSVQSYKVSTALLYRLAHLGNLLRTPISIGSKIKFIDTMGIGWPVWFARCRFPVLVYPISLLPWLGNKPSPGLHVGKGKNETCISGSAVDLSVCLL